MELIRNEWNLVLLHRVFFIITSILPFNMFFSSFMDYLIFSIHNKIFVWRRKKRKERKKVRVKNRKKKRSPLKTQQEIKFLGCRVLLPLLLLLLLLLRSVFHRYAFKYLFCIILFMLKFPFFSLCFFFGVFFLFFQCYIKKGLHRHRFQT